MRLKRNFFNRNTNTVAQELLGKTIVVRNEIGGVIRAIITETEAYHGFDDKASHASRKKTERNKIMFDKAGLVYVYLIYGMHYCLNFTTMPEGFPAAVLVRGIALKISNNKSQITNKSEITNSKLKKLKNKNFILINGPGRVTKYLGIDKSFYGEDLKKSQRIWIEEGIKPKKTIASKRTGVDYSGECKDWKWNYKIGDKGSLFDK